MNIELPLLTVAIPTYNRSDSLRKTLLQLSKEKNKSFIILISDDGSSDNTITIVKKYQKRMPNLFYSRNKEHIGYAGNVLKLYELVKTSYLWYLSDDDTVLPGAIDKILQAIEKYQPTIAVFSHTYIDPFGRKIINGVKEDKIYSHLSNFENYQSILRTIFLSVTVVKKQCPINEIKKANYTNNIFIQVTLSLLLLSRRFRFCEIKSVIVYRNTGFQFGEIFKFCLTDVWDSVFMIKHKFDNMKFAKLSKTEIIPTFLLYLSQKLGLFKSNGKPTKETLGKIVKYYGFYSLFFLSLPVLYYIIPAACLKLVYSISLFRIHGYKKAMKIYKHNINRAFKDKRNMGFVTYR